MNYKYQDNSPERLLNEVEIRKIREELVAHFQKPLPKYEEGRTPETCLARILWWNLDASQFEIAKRIAKKVWAGATATGNKPFAISDIQKDTILNSEFLDFRDLEWISWGLDKPVKNRKLLDTKNESAEAT